MLIHLIALIGILICGGIIVSIWTAAAKKINDRPKREDFDESDIYHPSIKKHEKINCN